MDTRTVAPAPIPCDNITKPEQKQLMRVVCPATCAQAVIGGSSPELVVLVGGGEQHGRGPLLSYCTAFTPSFNQLMSLDISFTCDDTAFVESIANGCPRLVELILREGKCGQSKVRFTSRTVTGRAYSKELQRCKKGLCKPPWSDVEFWAQQLVKLGRSTGSSNKDTSGSPYFASGTRRARAGNSLGYGSKRTCKSLLTEFEAHHCLAVFRKARQKP